MGGKEVVVLFCFSTHSQRYREREKERSGLVKSYQPKKKEARNSELLI
jgi:hypothetical protein